MLGKRPRPNFLRTASKSQLMPSYGVVVDRSPHTAAAAVAAAEAKPYPQRVIIGFTLGSSECRNPNPNLPCESPRSVLDANALLTVPIHNHLQQKLSAGRLPRSFLGNIMSGGSNLQSSAAAAAGAEYNCGGVGLGIVAAMEAEEMAAGGAADSWSKMMMMMMKSDPIAIIGRGQGGAWKKVMKGGSDGGGGGDAGLVAEKKKKKKEEEEEVGRYGGGGEAKEERRSIFWAASPAALEAEGGGERRRNFLSYCDWCRGELLQGNDIYMYRGDQAFCSVECRQQQMVMDDCKESSRCNGATFHCWRTTTSQPPPPPPPRHTPPLIMAAAASSAAVA